MGASRARSSLRPPGASRKAPATARRARPRRPFAPVSRESRASREKPPSPIRRRIKAPTAIAAAKPQRNSPRPTRIRAASTCRTTDIGRMMKEAMTLAARIVRAFAETITAPATIAATWQMVETPSETRTPSGK